jgi:hypothetical protein
MTRDRGGEFIVLVVILMLCGFVLLAVNSCEASDREACEHTGGHHLRVHGGRGGWVCIPAERP